MSQANLFGPLGVDYSRSPLLEIVDSQKRIKFTDAVESSPEVAARRTLAQKNNHSTEPETTSETLSNDELENCTHLAAVGTIEERDEA